MRVGFLGCGKIGQTMLNYLLHRAEHSISFVQDICYKAPVGAKYPVVTAQDEKLLEQTDLVVECATSAVLKDNFDKIIEHCDLMLFSVTAFADAEFEAHARELLSRSKHRLYLPHGAILGTEGIFDGRKLIKNVSIVTTKNPASLSRSDKVRTVVCDGTTREACKLYPRNVNVHASIALAGLGFDKTHSMIVSDPAVHTNTHHIIVEGEGIRFEFDISSFSTGGVTGKYTPYSACGSLDRVLESKTDVPFLFV